MSTEASTLNGAATAMPPSDPLAPYVEGLEGELAPLTARRAQLEAELSELQVQETRINEALFALRGKAPRKAAAPTRNSHQWVPAAKHLDDAYACLATAGEPLSKKDVMEKAGLSDAVATKALRKLREDGRIRVVGIVPGKGSAPLYEPMPNG